MPRFHIGKCEHSNRQESKSQEMNRERQLDFENVTCESNVHENKKDWMFSSRKRTEFIRSVRFLMKNSNEKCDLDEILVSVISESRGDQQRCNLFTCIVIGENVPVHPKRLAKFLSGELKCKYFQLETEFMFFFLGNVLNEVKDVLNQFKLCIEISCASNRAVLKFYEMDFAYYFPDGDYGMPFLNIINPAKGVMCCPFCFFIGEPESSNMTLICRFCCSEFSNIHEVVLQSSNHNLAICSQRSYYASIMKMNATYLGDGILEIISSFIECPFEIGQVVQIRRPFCKNLKSSFCEYSFFEDELFGVVADLRENIMEIHSVVNFYEMEHIANSDRIEINMDCVCEKDYIVTLPIQKIGFHSKFRPHSDLELTERWNFPRSNSLKICEMTSCSLSRIHMLLRIPKAMDRIER